MPPLPIASGITQALTWVAGKASSVAATAAMAPLNTLASGVADGVGAMLQTLATLWIRLDVPNVWTGSTAPVVAALQSEVAYLTGTLAVLGLIIGGCRLAWSESWQAGRDTLHGLLVLVLVTGAGVPVIGLLTSASDAWARSIIENGTNGTDFAHNLTTMLSPAGPMAPVLVVVFGVGALLLSVAQILELAFRAVVLVLMAGLLPISASMTTTPGGMRQFRHVVAWIVALVAYKPLAALTYATAFRLIGTHDLSSGSGIASLLLGLSVMLVAVLALPVLIRTLVPAVGAMPSSPVHVNASAALPSGARIVRSNGR